MKLLFLKSTWGWTRDEFPELFKRAAELGYDGVDVKVVPEDSLEDLANLKALVAKHNFKVAAGIKSWPVDAKTFTQLPGGSIAAHLDFYRASVKNALKLEPSIINVQSGSDNWNEAECIEFFTETLKIDQDLGATGLVCQETHRQRALFHPYRTARILQSVPRLILTGDVSHWTCVSERLLNDTEDDKVVMKGVLPHFRNLHARVGTTHSSQCPAPHLPVYDRERDYFYFFWKSVIDQLSAQGREYLTITMEYGPWPYMSPHVDTSFGDLGDNEFLRVSKVLHEHNRSARPVTLDNNA